MDIFCKIIAKEIPSYTLYEDEIVKVILDVNPNTPGHSLIIPKKHIKDLYDMDQETYMHIFNISKNTANLLTEKLNCDGITLIQNNGIAQEVKHFHLHIIPKYNNIQSLNIEEVYKKMTQ